MTRWLVIAAVLCITAGLAWAGVSLTTETIRWGTEGSIGSYMRTFPADGTVILQSIKPGRTALDLYPSLGGRPNVWDAFTELVLYRKSNGPRDFERLNFLATEHNGWPHYRISTERKGTGQYRDIAICHDLYFGSSDWCQFIFSPHGIFINTGDKARLIELGASDSCGKGYRCMRVRN